MQAGFIASQEFYDSANNSASVIPHSTAADRKWVDALYATLLGRAPDRNGEDFWTSQLQGIQTLSQVANSFTSSTEGLGVRVLQTYQRYLSRGASPDEIGLWVGSYHQGANNEDIVTQFIASDEFFNNANK
jgi:hypothetical protein